MSEVHSPAVEFTVVSSTEASPAIQRDKEQEEEEVKDAERNEVGESEEPSQAEASSVAPDTTSTVKAIDEEMMDPDELDKFFAKEKVFLVLTNSGKPVYCS